MNHRRLLLPIAVALLAAFGLSACHEDCGLTDNDPLKAPSSSPFTRAAAEDAMTLQDFYRCYGVGFSYDAIWGERCNMRDVHCRVLDFNMLTKWASENDESLFNTFLNNEAEIEGYSSFSHSTYTQETEFYADVDAEILIFNGSAVANIHIWETADCNDFFCKVRYKSPAMKMELQDASITALICEEGETSLLTPNFREAIDWIDKHRDLATVDSFLVCYGSHLVVAASAGGSIDINMSMRRDSIISIYSKEVLEEAAIKGILESKSESEEYKMELSMLNSADCSITVKGGDLSTIPNELLHFSFGERPDITQYIQAWQNSINYDPQDYGHNNLEMIDMEVIPIWELIPNEDVARLVRMRSESSADELIAALGYQNYTSTSFKLPQSVTCKMGGRSTTFDRPSVCNVLSAGRYVATICREQIDLPGIGSREVQVAYPIYNQHVNLSCGYTTYDDKAYNVCWIGGQCFVEADTTAVTQTETIYMSHGKLSCRSFKNVTYQPSHTVIGYEWPLAITKNGSVDTSKPFYLTYKQGFDFLLRTTDGHEQSGNLDGLPNWTYRNGRMVRNKESEYYYYWNPNEISY